MHVCIRIRISFPIYYFYFNSISVPFIIKSNSRNDLFNKKKFDNDDEDEDDDEKYFIHDDEEEVENLKQKIDNKDSKGKLSSVGGGELKIDGKYSWILKDLNLTDKKRILDVTDLIDNEEKLKNNKEKEEEDEGDEEGDQQNVNNNKNENQTNDTSHDAITSLMNDLSNNHVNKDDTDADDDDDEDDDERALEEQLTNILSTQHNPNYESIDINNVYYSDNDDDDDDDKQKNKSNNEILEEDEESREKLLKTATFKLLSPFGKELFSESDSSESDTEIKNAKPEEDDDDTDDSDASDFDEDDNIKDLQKKYKRIIQESLKRSEDSDDDQEKENVKREFKIQNSNLKAKFEPKRVENEEKLVKNSCLNDTSNRNNDNGNFKKFSKSFEVSLSDLDDRIGRLNNEIKLKRNVINNNELKRKEETVNKENRIKNDPPLPLVNQNLNSTYDLSEPSSNAPNFVFTNEKMPPVSNAKVMFSAEPTPSISITTTTPMLPKQPPQQHSAAPPSSSFSLPPQKAPVDLLQQEQKRQQQVHVNMIETMKKEWSQVLDKLQFDYKTKLEEQQRKHEDQLKNLYDEIKSSIKSDHLKMNKSTESATANRFENANSKNSLENFSYSVSSFIHDESSTTTTTTATVLQQNRKKQIEQQQAAVNRKTQSIENLVKEIDINQHEKEDYLNNIKNFNRSFSSDPNYVSNLRLSLKTKHSRHIQDLKSYYEQEIEELKKELQKAQTKFT